MHRTGPLAVAALLACSVALDAQTPALAPAAAPAPADGQIKGRAPDCGRPTRHDDEQPRQ